ncbi:MAG: DUF4197 family protein [Segetibacter sp.]
MYTCNKTNEYTGCSRHFERGDFAATSYLKDKTTSNLSEAFRPVIEQSLAKVNATKYWSSIFSTYNQFSLQK